MQKVFSNAKFWELFYKMEIKLDEALFEKIVSQLSNRTKVIALKMTNFLASRR
jgi:hypothetical protein